MSPLQIWKKDNPEKYVTIQRVKLDPQLKFYHYALMGHAASWAHTLYVPIKTYTRRNDAVRALLAEGYESTYGFVWSCPMRGDEIHDDPEYAHV